MNGEFNYWRQHKDRSQADYNMFHRNESNPWVEVDENMVRAFVARPDQNPNTELNVLQENGVYETRTEIYRSEPAGVC